MNIAAMDAAYTDIIERLIHTSKVHGKSHFVQTMLTDDELESTLRFYRDFNQLVASLSPEEWLTASMMVKAWAHGFVTASA